MKYFEENIKDKEFSVQLLKERAFITELKEAKTGTPQGQRAIEGPIFNTMEEKLAFLLGQEELVNVIRQCESSSDRIAFARKLADKLLQFYATESTESKLNKILKVLVGVFTEGIVTTPIDGLCEATIDPKGNFPCLHFAGPIRAAGGTVMGVIIIACMYLAKKFGLADYVPTAQEIQRCTSECVDYSKIHLTQIRPSVMQLDHVVRNCPVMIDGPETQIQEVSIHKVLPRINKSRIRGGVCLVVIQGLVIRAKKVINNCKPFDIAIPWMQQLVRIGATVRVKGSRTTDKENKYTLSIGRPILSINSAYQGFKLRLGTTSTTSICGSNLHPKAIELLGFLNIGSQVVLDSPGKGSVISGSCTDLNAPIVRYADGVREYEEGTRDSVLQVLDSGEIIVSLGDFLEFNTIVPKRDYCNGMFRKQTGYKIDPLSITDENVFEKNVPKIPPRLGLYLNNLTFQEYRWLSKIPVQKLIKDERTLNLLHRLVVPYTIQNNHLKITNKNIYRYYMDCITTIVDPFDYYRFQEEQTPGGIGSSFLIEYLNSRMASGNVQLCEKGVCTLFMRVGRCEHIAQTKLKSKFKKTKSVVHSLLEYVPSKGDTESFWASVPKQRYGYNSYYLRYCFDCKAEGVKPNCERCNGATTICRVCCNEYIKEIQFMKSTHASHKARRYITHYTNFLDLLKEVRMEELQRGTCIMDTSKKINFLCSTNKIRHPEEIIVGLLRSKYSIQTSKDGTFRITAPNLPCSHFTPHEANVSIPTLLGLGYQKDIHGAPLQKNDQYLYLKEQDVIISQEVAEILYRGTLFIDELLQFHYGLTDPYYGFQSYKQLPGTSLFSISPHTSSGSLCRILGFTANRGVYNNPLLICSRRRDCDGDMDAYGLALDSYINSSKYYTNEGIGALMSVPLTYTSEIILKNVGKEIYNLEIKKGYYDELDLDNNRRHNPEDILKRSPESFLSSYLKNEETSNRAPTPDEFQLNTPGMKLNHKTLANYYIDSETNVEKIQHMERLMQLTPYIPHYDALLGILEGHILPDIKGNFNAYFKQKYKCSTCKAEYSVDPLSSKCLHCFQGVLRPTVYEGMVLKYVPLLQRLRKNIQEQAPDRTVIRILSEKVQQLYNNIALFHANKNNNNSLKDRLGLYINPSKGP